MDIIFVVLMGGLWGSFANVCIYRLPKGQGVVSGRSHCPKCKKKIAWYDNIPIISYFLLGGKCRKCKKKISIQYSLVEFISIFSFFNIYYLYGITLTTLLLMILSLSLIIIFFIDLKHFIIPNSITFPMMALGFAKSFDPNLDSIFPNYILSLLGGLFGYGIIWCITFFYKQIKKRLESQEQTLEESISLMKRVNPSIIPRNHLVEKAIQNCYANDDSFFKLFTQALQSPYDDNIKHKVFSQAPTPDEVIHQTFCGT